MTKNNFVLFLISGLILSLVFFNPQIFSSLVFVFLIPILVFFDKTKNNFSPTKSYFYFFVSFLVFGTICSLWFLSIYPLTWAGIDNKFVSAVIVFPLWIFLVALFVFPISFWPYLQTKFFQKNFFLKSLFGAFTWIVLEYLRSWIVLVGLYASSTPLTPHYTYFSIGYSLYNIPFFSELLPIGGIYLAGFVIVLVNFLIYFVFFDKSEKREVFKLFIFIGLIVFSSNVYMIFLRNKNTSELVNVYLGNSKFQSSKNIEISNLKSQKTISEINNILANSDYPSIFILPENIDVYNPFVKNKKVFFKNIFVIGSYTNSVEKMYYLDTEKSKVGIYEKQILMPIGEYNPYFLEKLIKIFGIPHNDFADVMSGNTPNTFSYKNINFGSSICSENVSPYIFRNETRENANLIINIASHAPFSGSKLLDRQTVVGNSTRALETGRYFLTATNFGETFAVNDRGEKYYSAVENNSDEINFQKVPIKILEYKTPYVLFGDYMLYFAFVFFILFLYHRQLQNNFEKDQKK